MTADMFTQMRGVMTLQRMFANELALHGRDYPKLMSVRDAVRLATMGGAKGLRIDGKTGSLTPGKDADVILLDATALNVAPLNHAAGAVVTLMSAPTCPPCCAPARSRNGAAPFSAMTFPSSDGSLRQAATTSSPRRELRGTCSEREDRSKGNSAHCPFHARLRVAKGDHCGPGSMSEAQALGPVRRGGTTRLQWLRRSALGPDPNCFLRWRPLWRRVSDGGPLGDGRAGCGAAYKACKEETAGRLGAG